MPCRNGPVQEKGDAFSVENRIIGKSLGIIRQWERNAGQCVNSSLRSLCRNSRGQRPSLLLSISPYRNVALSIRFALFLDQEKIVTRECLHLRATPAGCI